MNKRNTLFLLFLTCAAAQLSAQSSPTIRRIPAGLPEKAPYNERALLLDVSAPGPEYPNPIYPAAAQSRNPEEIAGVTRFDAQAYGCMPSRFFHDENGNPVATWHFGTDPTGAFPERGTGYSVRENGVWTPADNRIESVRCGFPAIARLADGTQINVSHSTAFTPYRLVINRKAPGASTWTQTFLDNPPGGAGSLWPRIAIGGTDGKTVHIIGITTPSAFGGPVYQGMDGHLLYWRSTDGGLSWDVKAQIIPGCDAAQFKAMEAESYTVEANGETVAVGVFPNWNNTEIYKSFDNGLNWEKIIVNDFPDALENYAGAVGDGYTVDDIGFIDPNAPDSLAIFSSDGFGALYVDGGSQVHAWFGRMYYVDNDPAAGSFFYPGINGLAYWKESFGTDNIQIITGALDLDGDGELAVGSINEIGPYFNSLSSFPTVGADADGAIYLAYSALNELYRSDWGAPVDQFYRHVYLMKSTDNGDSWGEPYEVTKTPYVDEFILPFTEAVYPALPRQIGNSVELIYQQDALPGLDLWGDNHSSSDNGIVYVNVAADSIPLGIFTPNRPDPTLALRLAPNPVRNVLSVGAVLDGAASARAEIFDLLGRPLATRTFARAPGRQTLEIPVGDLRPGVYFIRVQDGNRFETSRFIKESSGR